MAVTEAMKRKVVVGHWWDCRLNMVRMTSQWRRVLAASSSSRTNKLASASVSEFPTHTELTARPLFYLFFVFSFRRPAGPQSFWLTSYIFLFRTVILLLSWTPFVPRSVHQSHHPPSDNSSTRTGSNTSIRLFFKQNEEMKNHWFSSKIYVYLPRTFHHKTTHSWRKYVPNIVINETTCGRSCRSIFFVRLADFMQLYESLLRDE